MDREQLSGSENQSHSGSGSSGGSTSPPLVAILPRYAVSVSDAHPNHYGNMVRIEDCQLLLNRALEIINSAIMRGMPVTEEVAEVSNLIRGTKWSGDTLKPNS